MEVYFHAFLTFNVSY